MQFITNINPGDDDDFVMPEREPLREGNDPLQKKDNDKGNG